MFLCIDTISSAAGITLVNSEFALHLPLDPQNSSEGIVTTIDKALKKAKISLADLQGIFVIKGPGSFTGLRVGLSVANQFAHQLKLPIVGLRTEPRRSLRFAERKGHHQGTRNPCPLCLARPAHSGASPKAFHRLPRNHRARFH